MLGEVRIALKYVITHLIVCKKYYINNYNSNGRWSLTKRELEKLLKEAGFEIDRQGKHEIWSNGEVKIPIPRHAGDIPKGTVSKILKDAGIK